MSSITEQLSRKAKRPANLSLQRGVRETANFYGLRPPARALLAGMAKGINPGPTQMRSVLGAVGEPAMDSLMEVEQLETAGREEERTIPPSLTIWTVAREMKVVTWVWLGLLAGGLALWRPWVLLLVLIPLGIDAYQKGKLIKDILQVRLVRRHYHAAYDRLIQAKLRLGVSAIIHQSAEAKVGQLREAANLGEHKIEFMEQVEAPVIAEPVPDEVPLPDPAALRSPHPQNIANTPLSLRKPHEVATEPSTDPTLPQIGPGSVTDAMGNSTKHAMIFPNEHQDAWESRP